MADKVSFEVAPAERTWLEVAAAGRGTSVEEYMREKMLEGGTCIICRKKLGVTLCIGCGLPLCEDHAGESKEH